MRKLNLIALIALAVAAFFVIKWAYPTLKDRYFKPEEEKTEETAKEGETEESQTNQEEAAGEEQTEESEESRENLIDVTRDDCNNECSGFQEEKDKQYCLEYCGLNTVQETGDCQDKTGLDKDYCLKDLAVQNKDFSKCNEISDSGIKEVCKNRITEDILDQY